MSARNNNFFEKIYKVVGRIPIGKVATYGQIAALVGSPRAARTVGWALHVCTERVPWHRVINHEGRISTTCLDHTADEQAFLLQQEGVKVKKVNQQYWIDLKKYRWGGK